MTQNSQLDYLRLIKRHLPRGYGKIIADKLNRDTEQIYKVVTGSMTDYDILSALIDLAEQKLKQWQGIEKKIENLKKLEGLLHEEKRQEKSTGDSPEPVPIYRDEQQGDSCTA